MSDLKNNTVGMGYDTIIYCKKYKHIDKFDFLKSFFLNDDNNNCLNKYE